MFKNTVKSATADLFELMKKREVPYEPFDGFMVSEIIDIYGHLVKQNVDSYIDYLSKIENDDDDYEDAQAIIDDLIRIREYDNEFRANEIYWDLDGRYEMWTYTTILSNGEVDIYFKIRDPRNDLWIIPDQNLPEKGIKSKTYTTMCCEALDVKIGDKTYTFASDMWSQK